MSAILVCPQRSPALAPASFESLSNSTKNTLRFLSKKRSKPSQTVVRISWGQTHWDLTLWALLRVGTAASLRLRRSRPPAQGCGRQTATLGPHPTTRFNPNGVAAHPSFSHLSRPEPLRGSMVPPPIPRVGLIPFGRPWAGGRKPFGLRGRPPFHRLPRGGWVGLGWRTQRFNASTRPSASHARGL
jgi:hypothetical protein